MDNSGRHTSRVSCLEDISPFYQLSRLWRRRPLLRYLIFSKGTGEVDFEFLSSKIPSFKSALHRMTLVTHWVPIQSIIQSYYCRL